MGRRAGAILVSLLLLLTLAVSASAAAVKMTVGVRFWRESGDKESMADSAVDTTREATLTRQPNGTFTLELPVKQLSSMNMTGRLTGIAIGEVNYDGTLSGDLSDGTAVLTLKNLPASVLTGSDSNKALAVTCSIKMDTSFSATSLPVRRCPSGSSAEKPNSTKNAPQLCYELRGACVVSKKVYSAMMLLPVISAGTGRPI